tara:strand:+ start:14747 stop:15574 length:828 start_codon:yes stop_codon:yes gene_type:complete
MNFTSKNITCVGLRTHYIEAGTGFPVVLVHGGGAGADAIGNWETTIEELSGKYHLFAPDMVGFGGTEVPRSEDYGFSQEERETHLEAFIEELNVGKVILVGNSMGGLTSLGVARNRPDLVEKLVLMGSAGIQAEFSPQLRSIVEYDFSPEGMERIVEALTGPDFVASKELVDYRYKLTIGEQARFAYDRIVAWMKHNGGLHVNEDLIARVTVPTLVMAGKNDLVVPLSSAYRFLELIPQSWGVIMPSCGHWPMIEHPKEFSAIVEKFIERKEYLS